MENQEDGVSTEPTNNPSSPNRPEVKRQTIFIIEAVIVLVIIVLGAFFLWPSVEQDGVSEESQDAFVGNLYNIEDETVYYYSREVELADPLTFEELPHGWARDRDHAYLRGIWQVNVDPETLKIYSNTYAVDKNAVWLYLSDVRKMEADPSTFSFVSHGYGKDSRSVFYFGEVIKDADPNTFESLRKDGYEKERGLASNWYTRDRNHVYYRANVIADADVDTFESLESEYAKDNNSVYHEGEVLTNADVNSFKTLGNSYAVDESNIFLASQVMDIDLNPRSLQVVRYSILKDDKKVFFEDYFNYGVWHEAQGVDAPSFDLVDVCASVEKSSGSYFRDKDKIYLQDFSGGSNPLKATEIDAETFEFLGRYNNPPGEIPYSVSYAKDKDNVYHSCGEVLTGANTNTFVDLGDGYARDGKRSWYLGREIDEIPK